MANQFYKRFAAEGTGMLLVAVVFAATVRILFYLSHMDETAIFALEEKGCLWNATSFLFANPLISILSNVLCIAIVATLISQANAKHLFIRLPSVLPSAFVILLFSCHPSFLVMRAEYVSLIFITLALNQIFNAYQSIRKSISAFNVYIFIILGSLFVPELLFYIPIAWIGLIIVQSFDIKAFLASFVTFVFIYFPVFSYYFFTDNIQAFYSLFTPLTQVWNEITILDFSYINYIILAVGALLLVIISVHYSMNSYKDKIRIRIFFSSVITLAILSTILYIATNTGMSTMPLYTLLLSASLIVAHFFALNASQPFRIYFIISLLEYIAAAIYFFLK